MDTISTLWRANTTEAAHALLHSSSATPLRLQNFVNNGFRQSSPNTTSVDCFKPRTGKLLLQISSSTGADVGDAMNAAAEAFPSWSGTQRHERARLLQKVAN